MDPTSLEWWPWVTGLVIPGVGAVGTVAVAIVAVMLAQGNSKRDRDLRARERRVEFAARLRAHVTPQILHAVLGTWLISEFDRGSNLGLLADQTDAPQAGELLAWSMMFLTVIKPMNHAKPESAANARSAANLEFEEVVARWVANPNHELDFDKVRGGTVEAVIRDGGDDASDASF